VVNRSEHDLRVFLHYKFTLELFFSTDICKDEYDLSLAAKIMRFNSDVIEITINWLALD
jgi:hypothetical protein